MARRQAEAELMQDIHFERIIKWTAGAARMAAVLFAAAILSLPLAAQQQGPLPPPPPGMVAPPVAAPRKEVAPPVAQRDSTSEISTAPPSVPVEQIIQQFAAREEEFRHERDNYTYTQTFVIQTIDADRMPDGEHRM